MPKVLALIPARGGSKGVHRKNMRLVAGKPLIAHTISQALDAQGVDEVIVSSDDDEILAVAEAHGAIALRRPDHLAQDHSPVIESITHAMDQHGPYDAVALLQPTSPLRLPSDITAAVELFLRTGQPVCSVFRVEDGHPARMYRIEDHDGCARLRPLMPELARHRRQDLPPLYLRNGALYVFGPREIDEGRIITDDMLAYVMDANSSVNVDTEFDLRVLKLVMEDRTP